nr:PorT family protein [Prevotella sp.]
MKKIIITLMAGMLMSVSASAQYYPNGRPIPPSKRTGYYSSQNSRQSYNRSYNDNDCYIGFRVGPGFSTVNSDSKYLDTNKSRTGLNIGMAVGMPLTESVPLYFETGLYYTQKGGKSTYDGTKFTYGLDYIELPLLLKYRAPLTNNITVEPFVGGYLACGVSGKIKDYGEREAYSSFSSDYDDNFNRFDGGVKLGCGMSFDMLYVEASYDIGLANVGKDDFDDTHTGCFNLTVGINF